MNITHSVDAMVLRELTRRCMFNEAHIQQVSYYLATLPNTRTKPLNQDELPTGNLGNLLECYYQSEFCSIRILDYLKTKEDYQYLTQEHRDKLLDITSKMLISGSFDLVSVHDSFSVHPNNTNYIRYWYKEILADLTESNTLPFICNQIIDNGLVHPLTKQQRQYIASKVRLSNYGIC